MGNTLIVSCLAQHAKLIETCADSLLSAISELSQDALVNTAILDHT